MAIDEVHAALDAFDRTFASGDPDRLTELFAPDARLLLLYVPAIEGRDAIRAHWTRVFGDWDPGAWQATHELVDVHDDRAYALTIYEETLRQRTGNATIDVRGRLILFLRREANNEWLVTLAMNSHRQPIERRDSSPD